MTASVTAELTKYRDQLRQKLHEKNSFNDFLARVEERTGVDRVYLVGGVLGVAAAYLVFSNLAELICNTVGFVYPAYVSIKAIESDDKNDDQQWLTYWVVFACFSVFDFASDTILGFFPFYWLFKCGFLLYLYLPTTMGAQKVYHQFLRPLVLRHQKHIDEKLHEVTGRIAEEMRDKVLDTASATDHSQHHNHHVQDTY